MKIPRIEAFDPKAAERLATSMDNLPRIEKSKAVPAEIKPKRARRKTPDVSPSPIDREAPPDEKQETLQERKKESKIARNLAGVAGYLQSRSLVTTSFRYPQELIDKLEDVQHRIRKGSGKKITKNSILIVALAHVLQDYEERGAESVLAKNVTEEK